MTEHPAAARRAIVRRLKDGEHPADLIADARKIGDAGHKATALMHLACDPRLPATKASSLIREATRNLKEVERPGRYAEAWSEALDVVAGLDRGPEAEQALEDLGASCAATIRKMPDGQWVTDAILAVFEYMGDEARETLLLRGLRNPGGEREVAKAAIDLDPSLVAVVKEHGAPEVLASVQARAGDAGGAVEAAWTIEEAHERREALRVLIWQLESVDSLMSIGSSADSQSPADRCAIWTMIAGRLDRLHHDAGQAIGAAKKALRELSGKDAIKAHRKLAQTMERAGMEPPEPPEGADEPTEADAVPAPDAPPEAEATSEPDAPPAEDGPANQEAPADEAPEAPMHIEDGPEPHQDEPPQAPEPELVPVTPSRSRHTFAIVDGYTGSLGPAHLRAVARAAPLCVAFDLDLALVDFPGDLKTIVDLVEVDTNVGEGGGYAKRLLADDRIRMLDADAVPAFPGKVIATTPTPQEGKATDLSGERICLLLGLGKQGIPKPLLNRIDHHYELTGQGISLETATAMGVLADRLGRL